jgi:hypothetical protein
MNPLGNTATPTCAARTALQLVVLSATLAVVGRRLWRRDAEAHPADPERAGV